MRSRSRLISTAVLALLWPVALTAAPLATAPATDPSPPALPTSRPAARDDANPDDPKTTIESPSIRSVVKLSMQNRMLKMTTDLPTMDDAAEVKIADFPGKTVAVVNGQRDLPVITIRHEISAPPSTSIIYTLSSLPTNLQLSVDSENEHYVKSVQFIQSTMNDGSDPDEKAVKLFVSVTDTVLGQKSVDLKLQADDVVQLRRKYPNETTEYLQPLLAALRQEEVVFAIDRRTAWQVLRGRFTVDPHVEEQVKKLVVQLDADDYATREAASESLDKLGEPAALVVLHLQRGSLSSEQNSRLDTFLAPYKPLSDAEAVKMATDVPFLLDCLYTDNAAMRAVTIDQLKQVTAKPIDVKIDAAPTAWLSSIRQLRRQLLIAPTTAPSVTRSLLP